MSTTHEQFSQGDQIGESAVDGTPTDGTTIAEPHTDTDESVESDDVNTPSSWADDAMAAISADLGADEVCEDVSVGWSTDSIEAPVSAVDTLLVLTSSRLGLGRMEPADLPTWVALSAVTNLDAIEGLGLDHIALELTAGDSPPLYLGAESTFVDSLVAALQRTAEAPTEPPPAAEQPSAEQLPAQAVGEQDPDTLEPDDGAEYRRSPWDTAAQPETSDADDDPHELFEPAQAATSEHLSPVVVDTPLVDNEPLVDPEPVVCAEPVADMFAPADPAVLDDPSTAAPDADGSALPTSVDDFRQVSPEGPESLVHDAVVPDTDTDGELHAMESSLPNLDDTDDADLPESLRLDSFSHEDLMSAGDTPPWLDPEMRWPRPLRGVQYLGGHPNHPRKRKNGLFGISPNGIDAEGAGFGDWSMNVQWAFINDISVVGADEATFNLGVRIGPKNSVISVEMDDGTVLNFEVRGKGPSTVRADLGSALGMAGAARQYRATHGLSGEAVSE